MTSHIPLSTIIWRYRLSVASIVGASLAFSVVVIGVSTPLYRSEAVVAPIDQSNQLESLSRVSRLVGLGEVNLDGGVQRFSIFRYLLHSPELARTLPSSDRILKSVFHEQWDEQHAAWLGPGAIGGTLIALKGVFGQSAPWRPPDYRNLSDYMRERLSISEVGTTGLVRLSFDHEDTEAATTILSEYIAGADELLRVQERSRKLKERDYLLEKLQESTISEVRLALANLIGATEQELVLLNTNQPVAYKLVQPVVLLPNPVYPPKLLFLLLGVAFGVVLSASYALLLASRDG